MAKKYIGEYHTSNFMVNRDGENDLVFEILSIENKYEFIRSVVGYTPIEGVFPYLKTKEDFIKVLDALNKEYDRQFGTTKQFSAEEYINPRDLKDGDYIHIKSCGFEAIYIFKEFKENKIFRHAYYDCQSNSITINTHSFLLCTKDIEIRKATSDEIRTLDNALYEQHSLCWNPRKKGLEKVGIATLRSDWHDLTVDVGAINTNAINIDDCVVNTIVNKNPNYYDYYCGSEQPLTPSESISNISIKTFIKSKKHYQLNFNN